MLPWHFIARNHPESEDMRSKFDSTTNLPDCSHVAGLLESVLLTVKQGVRWYLYH